jgi:hypothetical protein
MAARRRRLSEALAEPALPVPPAESAPAPAPGRQDRNGHKNIAGWFPLAVFYELEELRLQRSRERGRKVTLQELQAEAYNDLFKKYGRPEVAPRRQG